MSRVGRSFRAGGLAIAAALPLAMASIAGAHFLPCAWLQRTNVYVWLAVVLSAGALAIQIAAAPLVYRNARRLTTAM